MTDTRDAAPIVGEIDDLCRAMWAVWWWEPVADGCEAGTFHAKVRDDERERDRVRMRAFLARAALPSGGGAREATRLTDAQRMVLGERLMSALEVDPYPGITDQSTRWRLFGLLAESLVSSLTGGQKS